MHAARLPAFGLPEPENLDGLTFFGSDLAASGAGSAIVAWDDHSEACCTTLAASIRAPGEAFAQRVIVPTGTGWVTLVRTAMNHGGDAVIAFVIHTADNHQRIWAVFRPADGGFSAPVSVAGDIAGNYYDLDVGLSDNGEAVVVWDPPPPSSVTYPQVVHAAIGTATGFGAAQVLSDPSVIGGNPVVRAAPRGDAIVVWEEHHDVDQGRYTGRLFASFRASGAPAFGDAIPIGTTGERAWAQAVVSDSGKGLVTHVDDSSRVVAVPVDLSSGSVGTSRVIAGPTGWARVAMNRDGKALLAWETPIMLDRGPPYAAATWIAWGDASGDFGPLRDLTCPQPWRGLDAVAVNDDGSAAVQILNRGADVPSDADDRAEVARSSALIAPNSEGCPGWEPDGYADTAASGGAAGTPPATAPNTNPGNPGPPPQAQAALPRIALARGPLRIDHRGRMRLIVQSVGTGRLALTGTLLVSHRRIEAIRTGRHVAGAGAWRLVARLSHPAQRALVRLHRAQIVLNATLRTAEGRSATARARLRVAASR